jgi:hypothetical protein
VLGRDAVVDAQHAQTRTVGQPAGQRVVHVDVVEDEAAAVQVDHEAWRGVGGDEEPGRYAAGVHVLDVRDVLAVGGGRQGSCLRSRGGDVEPRVEDLGA